MSASVAQLQYIRFSAVVASRFVVILFQVLLQRRTQLASGNWTSNHRRQIQFSHRREVEERADERRRARQASVGEIQCHHVLASCSRSSSAKLINQCRAGMVAHSSVTTTPIIVNLCFVQRLSLQLRGDGRQPGGPSHYPHSQSPRGGVCSRGSRRNSGPVYVHMYIQIE